MSLSKDDQYYYWPKGLIAQISPHFTTTEFTCRCNNPNCTRQRISVELINRVEAIRNVIGRPIKVHSGFRCSFRQEELRQQGYETAKGVSQHELGNALDMSVNPMGAEFLNLCKSQFKAVGVALTFIHCDTRDDATRHWAYKTM